LAAFICAALWALHPLQTESVTYVVQRVESLAGLFYLLTQLCFIRAVDTPGRLCWRVACVAACFLGVATKEVLVSAPLFALLLDRALCASSWREVWSRRGGLHGALLSSWLLLALLVASTGGRGGSAGFGTEVSPWAYLLTQSGAILHYVRLAFWPHPLVFDYGTAVVTSLAEVWWQMALLVAVALWTAWAAVKRPMWALPGAWFLLLLAPSSSFVPVATQTMAEHRMYLPLAAVVVCTVLAVQRWAGTRGLYTLAGVAVVLGGLTYGRNLIYHDELGLWKQTTERRPENFRAWTTVGLLTAERGDTEAAVSSYERALGLAPDNAPTHLNLSGALLTLGRVEDAARHAAEAVRLEPENANARVNLGNALAALGRPEDAIVHYEAALAQEPEAEDVLLNLAAAWSARGDPGRAARLYATALRVNPDRARTWYEHALASLQAGDQAVALRSVGEALRRDPDDADAHFLRGNLAASAEDLATALRHFQRAVDLAPGFVEARNNLANALLISGQVDQAVGHYREILRVRPDDRRVRENLEQVLEWQRSQRGGR
jgi:tetratricopeptide (TPR) repeat protein